MKHFIILFCTLYTNCSFAEAGSISDIACNIFYKADLLSRLMWSVSIVIGIYLCVNAVTQYQVHRKNPKVAPLSNVIVFLLIAILAFSIPFFDKIFKLDIANKIASRTLSKPLNTLPDLDKNIIVKKK